MKALYFTQAELEVMLELSGGPSHTLYRVGPPPDDQALTQAFASLYRRGFLIRTERAFAPAPQGDFFREMCAAPFAVVLKTGRLRNGAAVCYCGGETVWVCETVRTPLCEQVRLLPVPMESLETWLFESGILDPPALTDADAQELSLLPNGEVDPDSVRLRLEQYRNGGEALGTVEVLTGNGLPFLRIREGETERVKPYTTEALRAALSRRFRKDEHQAL